MRKLFERHVLLDEPDEISAARKSTIYAEGLGFKRRRADRLLSGPLARERVESNVFGGAVLSKRQATLLGSLASHVLGHPEKVMDSEVDRAARDYFRTLEFMDQPEDYDPAERLTLKIEARADEVLEDLFAIDALNTALVEVFEPKTS